MYGVIRALRLDLTEVERASAQGSGSGLRSYPRMLARQQAETILRALNTLPPDKITEVQDFVSFLQERYGAEESDSWSAEDLHDLTAAVLANVPE